MREENCKEKEFEFDEVTARIRITLGQDGVHIQENVFNNLYLLSILREIEYAILSNSEKIESHESVILDGSEPFICLAYNKEDGRIQISANDVIEENYLGVLTLGKLSLVSSILGFVDNTNEETLRKIKEILG